MQLEEVETEEKRQKKEKRMMLKKLTDDDRAMKENYKNSIKAPLES